MFFRFLLLAFMQFRFLFAADDIKFSLTALGGSYASGVGSGNYIRDSEKCLRYDQGYPQKVLANFTEDYSGFQNYACSNLKAREAQDDAEKKILPKSGESQLYTLTIGDQDLELQNIIDACILNSLDVKLKCEDQIKRSHHLLFGTTGHTEGELAYTISSLIDTIFSKGRDPSVNGKFRLFVTGYGQFFNADTPECDNVTLAVDGNAKYKPTKLLRKFRKNINNLILDLNGMIQEAVILNAHKGVTYIDIDEPLAGRRFCEPGVDESERKQRNHWFWHYPYSDRAAVEDVGHNNSAYGERYKTFHPTEEYNEWISRKIVDAYKKSKLTPSFTWNYTLASQQHSVEPLNFALFMHPQPGPKDKEPGNMIDAGNFTTEDPNHNPDGIEDLGKIKRGKKENYGWIRIWQNPGESWNCSLRCDLEKWKGPDKKTKPKYQIIKKKDTPHLSHDLYIRAGEICNGDIEKDWEIRYGAQIVNPQALNFKQRCPFDVGNGDRYCREDQRGCFTTAGGVVCNKLVM